MAPGDPLPVPCLLLPDHHHPGAVHHRARRGYLGLTGRHQVGGCNGGREITRSRQCAQELTYDKCECGGHGDGEDDEEDRHGSPAAGAAEIFGEVGEPGPGLARLDRAQGVEVALQRPGQLLQLGRAPAKRVSHFSLTS